MSAAKIKSNRLNALLSTGPKSAKGKAQSSQNAVKHGFFALRLLPGEDADAFQDLRDDLLADWNPQGVLEGFYAAEIAKNLWCLRRLDEAVSGFLAELVKEAARDRRSLWLEVGELEPHNENEWAEMCDDGVSRLEIRQRDVDKALQDELILPEPVLVSARGEERRQILLRNLHRNVGALLALQDRRKTVEVRRTIGAEDGSK